MIDAPPRALPAGALGELFRRIGMELGAIPPPDDTQRVQRQRSVSLRGTSMNDATLKSRSFDANKTELQGLLMREFHRMHYLLERPIPSVREGGRQAPVWVHARLRFDKPANRDDENYRVLVAKALGDALTGPKLRRVNGKFVDAKRTMTFRGASYTGGWLRDDNSRNWVLTFDIDPHLGPPCLTLLFVWDEPIPA